MTAAHHVSVERLRALIPQRHRHAPLRSLNELHLEKLTTGARIADKFAATMGSWTFIIIQSILLVFWVAVNVMAWVHRWDPYPFILLNLALSFQAAYTGPIVMMSQNRQAEKDRLAAQHDFEINVKAEGEIHTLIDHLEVQHEMILAVLERVEAHELKMAAMLTDLRDSASSAGSSPSPPKEISR